MWPVVESNSHNGSPGANERGVFANLPRTRPQRDSPRRAAARNSSSTAAGPARKRDGSPPAAAGKAPRARARTSSPAMPKGSRATTKSSQATPKRRPAAAGGPRVQQARAPRQGFESEGERGSRSLQPPGAADLVVSAAELVTEFAKGGLSRGERLLRDLISRRP